MARKRKFLAVTPLAEIPWDIRDRVISAFGGTKVSCQMCGQECVIDSAIDTGSWDIFYCITCSTRTGLTIEEVVDQLISGLSISYARFVLLMEVLRAEPGTRRYAAFQERLEQSGISVRPN